MSRIPPVGTSLPARQKSSAASSDRSRDAPSSGGTSDRDAEPKKSVPTLVGDVDVNPQLLEALSFQDARRTSNTQPNIAAHRAKSSEKYLRLLKEFSRNNQDLSEKISDDPLKQIVAAFHLMLNANDSTQRNDIISIMGKYSSESNRSSYNVRRKYENVLLRALNLIKS